MVKEADEGGGVVGCRWCGRRGGGEAVLPANFYIIIQQMLDSYNNYYIISTANAVIIVLQFVSISQPSLYHL